MADSLLVVINENIQRSMILYALVSLVLFVGVAFMINLILERE